MNILVQKRHPHDGTAKAGRPITSRTYKVVCVEDHCPVDGAPRKGVIAVLDDGTWEFVWNLEVLGFDQGALWGSHPWTIQYNVSVDLEQSCPHCVPTVAKDKVRCQRVVVAITEGCNDGTGVCLDCILEAVGVVDNINVQQGRTYG